jgi:ATP-binding cassette subfamily G (WHITE) protein 2 (PDR)
MEGFAEDDPAVIPTSGDFDPYKWALLSLKQLDEEIPREHVGFAYRNVNISGTGAVLQLQDTVESVLLAHFLLGSLISLALRFREEDTAKFQWRPKE